MSKLSEAGFGACKALMICFAIAATLQEKPIYALGFLAMYAPIDLMANAERWFIQYIKVVVFGGWPYALSQMERGVVFLATFVTVTVCGVRVAIMAEHGLHHVPLLTAVGSLVSIGLGLLISVGIDQSLRPHA